MKKALCLLIALMVFIPTVALTETGTSVDPQVIERFSETWVSIDVGLALEIWDEDGVFYCRGNLGIGDDQNESQSWEYATCQYDAASDSLQCANGTRVHKIYDAATQKLTSESTTTGLTAVICFADGADKLIWKDSEGMLQDYTLLRLGDAEELEGAEARAFAGRWGCGRATIDITEQFDDSFRVLITWGSSAAQSVEWNYACVYDGAKKCLYSYKPGNKNTVTYVEGGEIASTAQDYNDGQATFTLEGDGMLLWHDAKENAGADMRFERGIGPGTQPNTLIEGGSFVVEIPVAENDNGWQAAHMEPDYSVYKPCDTHIVENTFVARYDPTGDGDVFVRVKHMNGAACDEAFTWDLRVKDGAVQEVTVGPHLKAPDEARLNPRIEGEWLINDNVMAGMTIAKNEGQGWAVEIRFAYPEARVLRANALYDCERNALAFNDGTYYAFEIDNTPEGKVGDAVASNIEGALELYSGEDEGPVLAWSNTLNSDETAFFHRPLG